MTDRGSAKRLVNELMRDGLRIGVDTEPIAFFCECANEDCYQAIWLSASEYDRARADPRWEALIGDHRANAARAQPIETSAREGGGRERRKTVTVGDGASAETLTPRERDVVAAVGRGLTNKHIAQELGLSLHTVKFHLSNAYAKLEVRTRLELFCWSLENAWRWDPATE
ncbi:MAG TPA: LuxR C-terminal-related transcriptional regulator [Gaiellaceae bacterium]|nr:LuxR C-terminal-related transcriptional regulator [Gaiellaceae bacterium]